MLTETNTKRNAGTQCLCWHSRATSVQCLNKNSAFFNDDYGMLGIHHSYVFRTQATMNFIPLLNIFATFMLIDARYSFHHSDDRHGSNSTFDCLYAYIMDYTPMTDLSYINNYHLNAYCRRTISNEKQEDLLIETMENVEKAIPFVQLYRLGVTSTQLLNWFAPVDIAERYEKEGEDSAEVFYNCSSPWFGSACQYTFDSDALRAFGDTVQSIFANRFRPEWGDYSALSTCYPFIAGCDRGISSICLDWREVCDGSFDCINGEDEQLCQLLEISECSDNEFRCHYGGQCITFAFVHDGPASLDCLDGTDESALSSLYNPVQDFCSQATTFRCEEKSRRYPEVFSCSEGEFLLHLIPQLDIPCFTLRDRQISVTMLTSLDHISDSGCQQAFYCLLGVDSIISEMATEINDRCEPLIDHCSSQWLTLPEYPIMFNLFQFVYLTNRSITDFKRNLMPDFICFNSTRCPAFLFCSIDIGMHNGITCCRTNRLSNATLTYWHDLYYTFENVIQRCLKIGSDKTCSHPSLFHCSLSSKCISKHRLVDGWDDCYFGEDESYPACQLNDSTRFICQSESNKCLSIVALENDRKDCDALCVYLLWHPHPHQHSLENV